MVMKRSHALPFLTRSFHISQLADRQRREGSRQTFRRSKPPKPTSQWHCRTPKAHTIRACKQEIALPWKESLRGPSTQVSHKESMCDL